MKVRSLRERAADNRANKHQAAIRAAQTPRRELNAALAWVQAEAAAPGTDIQTVIAEVGRLAMNLNERSRHRDSQ